MNVKKNIFGHLQRERKKSKMGITFKTKNNPNAY